MKTENEPLIVLVLRTLAVLAAIGAAWSFVQMLMANEPASGISSLWGVLSLSGGAISLWWMGEICRLLGEIVERLETSVRSSSAPSAGLSRNLTPSAPSVKASQPSRGPAADGTYRLD